MMIAMLVVAVRTLIRSQIEIRHSGQTPPPPAGAVSGRPRFISDAVMGLEKSAVVPSDHARNCRFKPQSDSLKLSALKNFDIDSPSCSEPESFPCHCSLASRLSPPDKRFRSMRIVNVTMPPADDTCVYDPLHRGRWPAGRLRLGRDVTPTATTSAAAADL